MQDRFKFRVWNTLVKEFSYFDKPEIQIGTDGFDNGLIFPLSENSNLYMGKCLEPQFCTGLKDKNDKLIYEGDIVADVVSGCVAIIEYLHSSYSLMAHIRRMDEFVSIEDICFVDKEGTPFEVVGNIYENPELLEDK